LSVFKSLRVVDLSGKPTFGECAPQWVFDFVAAIFGALNPETATRLIEEFFLLIAKKNTKSTLAAGIMVTALCRNWRYDNEALILAPTKEVADNSFTPAAGMVEADPELSALFHVNANLREITHRTTNAFLKVVAADSDTVSGKKAAFVLVDELWLFGKRANADAMLKEATGGLVSRPEGFVIYLSTQSDEPPAGVFKSKLDYFREVRDGGIIDRKKLPVLYEFPPAMLEDEGRPYLKPENFYITNPNLGRSVRQEWLADKLEEEKRGPKEGLALFLAKHLNVEIGMRLRANRWAGADHWEAAAEPGLTFESILARSEVVVMGADGGGLDDLLGLSLKGRDSVTKRTLSWHHAWARPEVLERRKSEAPRFRDFAAAGDMTITSRPGQDAEELEAIFRRVNDSGLLWKLGVDPAGVGAIVTAANNAGIEGDRVVGISQGWKLNGAIKTMERDLADGVERHCGQPMMAWCVSNAKAEQRGNAVTITKQAAGTAKIDPLMASFNATALMAMNPPAQGKSFWETAAAA